MQGRRIAAAFRDACAEFSPAFANGFLVATGALLGIRETRRVIGNYYLTIADFVERRSFPDEICRNCYYIDVHGKPPKAGARAKGPGKIVSLQPGESHGIPYRCLTPKGLRNVLVAGRSISSDREVNGSVRVMPVCLATGEAAGVAAGLAARGAADIHAVDPQELRRRLKRHGAYLPPAGGKS
jgi:hypothetical protein